jgi:hypothetical protein
MSNEDDLGDFFAEIEQVEENIDQYKEKYEEPAPQAANQETVTNNNEVSEQQPSSSSLPPQSFIVNEVISKPAEISKTKSLNLPNYPLFTYEAIPESSRYTQDSTSSSIPSSSGATTSSYYQQYPAPPTTAPPAAALAAPVFIPRQNKKFERKAGGESWVDDTLQEWPENDYRIFVGDLGKEVTDEMLAKHFQMNFKSFARAKVIRSKNENKARGYGFVSFLDPNDCLKAVKEFNGKYLCSR